MEILSLWTGREEVAFETAFCHSQVFESGVKYPAVILLGQPHPVLNLWKPCLPYLSYSLWSRQNESGQ